MIAWDTKAFTHTRQVSQSFNQKLQASCTRNGILYFKLKLKRMH